LSLQSADEKVAEEPKTRSRAGPSGFHSSS